MDIGPTQFDTASQAFIGNGADGLTIAALTVSNFGPTATDSTSPGLTFRVTNATDAQTTSPISTTIIQSNRFRIVADGCANQNIAPGSICDIQVVFEPTILGADVAVLGVSATVGGQPTINMSGTGVTGFFVGGTVSGHTGPVTIRNNGYDDVIVPANTGTFQFGDHTGSNYTVTIGAAPAGQNCVVSMGTGIVNNANVTNVVVTCMNGFTQFVGPTQNVAIASLTGWTQCFINQYDQFASIAAISAACPGAQLMLACRVTGSPTLQLLAHAPRADVLLGGGGVNATHASNGSEWYLNNAGSGQSWGFAGLGLPIFQNSADVNDSGLFGGSPLNLVTGATRLSWHTNGGDTVNQGWRCGNSTSLNNSAGFERLVFQAN
jgi:hypothetical protein